MRYLLNFVMVPTLVCMPGSFAGKKTERDMIHLVPVGKVEHDLLAHLCSHIEETFPFSVKIDKALPDPDYAYTKGRGQYKSDLIIGRLQKLGIEGVEKILAVVNLDLYTPGLNFVFGQALTGGKAALIALPRLRPEFNGLTRNKELYRHRAVEEAVHELGHTFDLSHCPNIRCVMHFSNSLADTDGKGKDFCEGCLDKLPCKKRKR